MNTFALYTRHHSWQEQHMSFSRWPELFVFLFVLLCVAILAFEVWMFFDCVLDRKLPSKNKVWWVIGMLALHPIVAIFYYFMVYRARNRKTRK